LMSRQKPSKNHKSPDFIQVLPRILSANRHFWLLSGISAKIDQLSFR
jgi:hypothetical protein